MEVVEVTQLHQFILRWMQVLCIELIRPRSAMPKAKHRKIYVGIHAIKPHVTRGPNTKLPRCAYNKHDNGKTNFVLIERRSKMLSESVNHAVSPEVKKTVNRQHTVPIRQFVRHKERGTRQKSSATKK
jgi:hypothetical protein